jgi:hypothetical protein
VLHWATIFAKKGGYKQIRSLFAWCRRGDGANHGIVYVAIRPQLIAQLKFADLARLSYQRLADLCERYRLRRRVRVGRCNKEFDGGWAIELNPEWTSNLLLYPAIGDAQEGEA